MKKRKHRLTIDVTFNRKLSYREAVKAFGMLLSKFGLSDNPIYSGDEELYMDKMAVMEIRRLAAR